MKFAKLFDFENDIQVLLTVVYKEDTETYELQCRTDINGCIAQNTYEYLNEEIAVQNMEKFSIEQAITFRKTMEVLFK